MKITENQLRKAIRKEKSKVNEGRVGQRTLDRHADISLRNNLHNQIENFLEMVEMDAHDESGDETEASELAELAFAELVAQAVTTLGYHDLANHMRNFERKRYASY